MLRRRSLGKIFFLMPYFITQSEVMNLHLMILLKNNSKPINSKAILETLLQMESQQISKILSKAVFCLERINENINEPIKAKFRLDDMAIPNLEGPKSGFQA